VKLLQNRLPEASLLFCFEILLEKVFKICWKKFLGDPTFSSFLNASLRSAISFTTETKRYRQRRFPILFALIVLAAVVDTG